MRSLLRPNSGPRQKQAARPTAWRSSRGRLSFALAWARGNPAKAGGAGARYSDAVRVARQPCDANLSPAMAVKQSATNRTACCTTVLAVLASPSISGGSRELLRRPWRSEFPLEFQWFAPPVRDGVWPVYNVSNERHCGRRRSDHLWNGWPPRQPPFP